MEGCITLMKADEIQKIGRLARLLIKDEEAADMAATLSEIFDLVEQLDAADLEGVEPLAHPLDLVQRLREDRVTEGGCREAAQAVAPQVADGLYLVPKVIE